MKDVTGSKTDTTVTKSIIINVPIDTAFVVFTAQIDRWWHRELTGGKGKLRDIILEPKVGGRMYNVTSEEEFEWGKVLDVDAPHSLRLQWGLNTAYVYEADPDKSARLDVSFEATSPTETKVTIVQTDIDKLGNAWEPMRDRMYDDTTGWGGLLKSYARVAESLPAEYWAQFSA